MATLDELFKNIGTSVNTMTDDLRSAETEKKMAEQTNPYGDFGALNEALLNKISGGQGKLINQYLDAALPMPEETNNWMPVYEFFRQMTENASKPGATVFGSAAQATSAPMDYLNAKKAEARKTQQARAALGLQIAPSLKPKAATYRDPKEYMISMPVLDEQGQPTGQYKEAYQDYLTAPDFAKLQKQGARFTSVDKTTGSGSTTKPFDVQITEAGKNAFALAFPNATLPTNGIIALRSDQLATLPIGGYEIVQATSTGDGTKTPKAYAVTEENLPYLNVKLGKTLQRDANGNVLLLPDQFVLVQDLVGPQAPVIKGDEAKTELARLHDDLAIATPDGAEAVAIQKQIDDLILASGFNKDIFQAEGGMRKEWNAKKVPFNKIETSHQKLKTALARASGVGDMSAIFVYMKMLDPGSVVRESEFAQAQQTSGAVESLIARMKQIAEGDKLSAEQRIEFLALADEFYGLARQDLGRSRLDLGTIVQNNLALNPQNVFGSESATPKFYADRERFSLATQAGFTMDELWASMSDAEKQAYGGQ